MKIGFDAKRAVGNMTGLGNYSRLVVEELARRHPEHNLLLYTPTLTDDQRANPRLERINRLANVEFRLPYGLGPFGSGSLWRTVGVTRHFRADGLDLYHGLSNEIPWNAHETGVPTVVTVHDLIYRTLPYCYAPADRLLYNMKYGRSARRATRVIAISECTKKDLVRFHHVDPDKIDVVYQGCDPAFRRVWTQDELRGVRERYGLGEGRYMLQVGTIERRKNLGLSVSALEGVDPDVRLVAVGRDNKYLDEVRRLARQKGVEGRLTVLDNVAFRDLPGLNQGAEAVLYPSRYEGFGIPVLEGLESRRPVIAAKGSCLEEAGGQAAFYVDPDSETEMVEAIRAALKGGAAIDRRIGDGLHHAARFNTDDMTNRIMQTYERALSTAAEATGSKTSPGKKNTGKK